MNNEIDPYTPPASDDLALSTPAVSHPAADYYPWKRGRTYTVFILGMVTAGFLMLFFHPLFALIALISGIPTVVIANKEIDEFPQAAVHPFIKWGKLCGKLGLIVGGIACFLWFVVLVVAVVISV
jgi:hypothetical protein